ncbi:MAG: pyridoxamine 5'-phosphate oxidase family protein [Dysgonomonas sp.]|nr:pyridoxamine 5'-phosphate oxidase family protein [Dysgonomonas sp.]
MVTITIEEKELIEGIIKQCKECFVGMIDEDNKPYVLPMNFGYKNGIIYLHSAPEGTSIRSLEKNPEVCITFSTPSVITHQNEEVACSYRVKGSSAMCKGKVVFVEDYDEKVKVLDVLMENYTDMPFKYSEPSVRNVKVWKVEIEEMTGRLFGVPYKESHKYNQ